jgi:SagB-type dehydrogenase family enzyme
VPDSFFLSLHAGAVAAAAGPTAWAVRHHRGEVVFRALSPGTLSALCRLGRRGADEAELVACVRRRDGDGALPRLVGCLDRLDHNGLLLRSARVDGVCLASLVPTGAGVAFAAGSVVPGRRYRLSRFAAVRREGGSLVIESPRSPAHVVLHDARAAALVGALAEPGTVPELADRVGSLEAEAVTLLLALLLGGGGLDHLPDDGGAPSEDEIPALRTWSFEDLLFHTRRRCGPGHPAAGAPERSASALPPAGWIDLPRPDADRIRRDDPPLTRVQAARRSVREYGEGLLTVRQLGEFLYRTTRAEGPFPGAQERLEIYPVVERCAALDAGLYRYDPRHHRLARLCGRTADVERLLADEGAAASLAEPRLQVLLVLAARRSASVPYALLLQRVGALFQTMYLVATAMGLAPCALGHGDADAFARAAGADYSATPSVGEFLLGSMR